MKKIVWGVGAVGVAIAAWLGSGVYVGKSVEQSLQGLSDRSYGQSGLIVKTGTLKHTSGALQSSGELPISISQQCLAAKNPENKINAIVRYSTSHLPTPSGVSSAEWTLVTEKSENPVIQLLLGESSVLELKGHSVIGFDGAVKTDVSVPKMIWKLETPNIEMDPSNMQVTLNKRNLQGQWKIGHLQLTEEGGTKQMVVRGIDLNGQMKFNDQYKNVYDTSSQVKIAQITDTEKTMSMEGFEIVGGTKLNNDRFDSSADFSLNKMEISGYALKDFKLRAHVNKIDARSFDQLSRALDENCEDFLVQANPQNEKERVEATRALLLKGASLEVTELTGKLGEGDFKGHFKADLAPSNAEIPSLVEQLTSTAKIEIHKKALPPMVAGMVGMIGAQTQGDHIILSYEYNKDSLKINGKDESPTLVTKQLNLLDETLRDQLARVRNPQGNAEENQAQITPENPTEEAHDSNHGAAVAQPAKP